MKSSKSKTDTSALRWIYSRAKGFLPLIILVALFSALISLSFVFLALVSKRVLDIATENATGSFTVCGILLLSIVVFQIILNCIDVLIKTVVSGRLTISLRSYLFSVVTTKKYADISRYHSGDLLNRFTSDTDVVVSAIVNILPSVCSMLAKIIGGISALLILDTKITLIIALLGISVPAIGRLVNRKFKKMHKLCQESEGRTRSFLQECFENTVIIKAFESALPFTSKLNQFMDENFRLKIKRSKVSMFTNMSLYSFFTLGYYGILIWGAGKISAGAMTYGTLMAFLQLVSQLRAPLQNISGILPQYYSALASAERLMELEQGEDDLEPSEKALELKQDFSGIDFDNVSFAYNREEILKDCSFSLEKGKITAITGESGSGKSTVFKLLLGLFTPVRGQILLNGNIPLDTSHRGLFAYVPQGNLLLSGTIKENITLCDNSIGEEEIIKACRSAEIYDFIKSLPTGFETVLSERGSGLSEGQIQRISIARALLTNAPVILLDEATSALDEETETRLLNNMKQFSDKTIIFVTHRNTSLKVCDKIIHLEDKSFVTVKE